MVSNISNLYDKYILGYPRLAVACLALLFAAGAYYAKDFKLDASADSLLLESDKDLRIFREINERYGNREFLFVTFTPNADLFSDASLGQIDGMRAEFTALEGVESVLSLMDVPLVKIVGGKLSEVAKNYRTLKDPKVDRNAAKHELITSPAYIKLVISPDGQTTALVIYLELNQKYIDLQKNKTRLLIKRDSEGLTPTEKRELEQVLLDYALEKTVNDAGIHNLIRNVRDVIAKYNEHGVVHLGGVPMIADDMITFIKNDLVTFGIGVLLFLISMLTVIFRQVRWVVLPLLSCVFACVIMMGLLGFTGWRVTVISSNFISLMLIITMSMNVHLIVRYRQLVRDYPGLSQRELVFETAKKMVAPCLYTALTTMIGFGSLVVSGIKPVIDFGWMMTLGLAVTFLTSFLLFPSILVCLNKIAGVNAEREDVPFTSVLAKTTEKHGGKVFAASALLAVISVLGMTKLIVENSFINYFSKDTEIYQGLKLIDDKLGGTTPLDIIIKFDPVEEYGESDVEDDEFASLFGEFESDPTEAWFTSYKIDRIKKVHDYLDGLPAAGKVLSLASVLRLAEELNEGEEFDAFELAIIYKRIPAELRESMIDPYISIANNEARINVRIVDSLPDLRRNELLKEIRDGLREMGLEQKDFQMTGLLVLYNNMLQSLFRSQILTLGVVMLGIALTLLVLFRSLSLAVIGIIPNILAAGIILGLMGWLGIPLDIMTITIAAITIGIAVDNSIHYIYRFREELPRQNQDYLRTLHYCHANIGRAVYYTALTIIVGFSILVLSNFIPTIYFGLLTALAMFIALLAALTLLPRLILWWRPF